MDELQFGPEDIAFEPIWEKCREYTMTSRLRGLALFRSIRYLHQNFLKGDIVECGVWQGGSTMIALHALRHFGIDDRRVWLFDTFAGMTEPSALDIDCHGQSAEILMDESADRKETELVWAHASLDEVRRNIASTGYDPALVEFVVGDVRKTLRMPAMESIALLRLDTDFYDSTLIELDMLYPRLIEDGVLIVDDFGHWQGARQACDEYFDAQVHAGEKRPLFHFIDYTGRLVVKPAPRKLNPSRGMPRYDYLAPGLEHPNLIERFPELVERDPSTIDWRYLRKQVPHIWRSDARANDLPDTGVISVDEADLLYNNALSFAGKRGLEVGCHYGWSSAHLNCAELDLDVVDPALGDSSQAAAVADSISRGRPQGKFRLWPGFSPGVLSAIHGAGQGDFSFVFIDGLHDGDAPRLDAEAVMRLCAETACVMLHDLVSPFVTAGLAAFADAGWRTGVYNTMQIMGIAWRGNFEPVQHICDPYVPLPAYSHLDRFKVLSVAAA